MRAATTPIFLVLALLTTAGCALGPRQIHTSRQRYNEAVQQTFHEEMLLNLVRLKYREAPEFITIGGIAAQYTFDAAAGIGADFRESNPKTLGLDMGIGRTERPTISYAPLRDATFNRGLLSPIGVETLAFLARTGWRWDRILRSTVQNMNGVDNASSAGGPTPRNKPDFEEFFHITALLRELQQRHQVEIASVKTKVKTPINLPTKQLDGDFFLRAIDKGYAIENSKDDSKDGSKEGLVLVENKSDAGLIFSPRTLGTYERTEIVNRLRLDPGRLTYKLQLATEGQLQAAHTDFEGPNLAAISERYKRDDITVSTRSLLETMYYLSQGIQIPVEHMEKGLVTATTDGAGGLFDWTQMTGELLRVFVAEKRPDCAAVAVQYRGYWYYIDDRDLNSQSTFTLLLELLLIEVRSGGGNKLPVFTLGL